MTCVALINPPSGDPRGTSRPRASSQGDGAARGAAPRTALVVDDDSETRGTLVDVLRREGYETRACENGREALDLLRGEHRVDVIVLDLAMPVMDGWQFRAEQLRDPALATIPVVVLSANASPEAAAIDVDAYLTKPFEFETLVRTVERVVLQHDNRVLRARLDEVERLASLGTLAAGVAHEIGNPLAIYRLLVDSVDDYAIFILDPAGRVASWNAGAERINGYTANEIIGKHFSCFYSEEDRASGKCERELEGAARDGRFEDEGWRIRKDGSLFWANVHIAALRSGGRLVGFAKLVRDLTERRKAEVERIRLAEAQEAVRLRDEFLSIASHELRTPLTALMLQVRSLRDLVGEADSKIAQRAQRMERSVVRLRDLIDALMDVSRIASGRLSLKRTRSDLVAMTQEVVDRLAERASAAGCELVYAKETPSAWGAWDPLRIEQVITNVLENALKYGSGKPVRVTVGATDQQATVRVIDGGPGFPEQDRERIFKRFERAASARNYGGLGLGLYVSKQIVSAHEGTISAKNESSGGACFTIILPMGPSGLQK